MDNPLLSVVTVLMTMPEVQNMLMHAAEFGDEILDEGEKKIKDLIERCTSVS